MELQPCTAAATEPTSARAGYRLTDQPTNAVGDSIRDSIGTACCPKSAIDATTRPGGHFAPTRDKSARPGQRFAGPRLGGSVVDTCVAASAGMMVIGTAPSGRSPQRRRPPVEERRQILS